MLITLAAATWHVYTFFFPFQFKSCRMPIQQCQLSTCDIISCLHATAFIQKILFTASSINLLWNFLKIVHYFDFCHHLSAKTQMSWPYTAWQLSFFTVYLRNFYFLSALENKSSTDWNSTGFSTVYSDWGIYMEHFFILTWFLLE